jgi:hypothetical protein
MATVFLSHASADDALASQLELWLIANGFSDLFVDHSAIDGGEKWAITLRDAHATCRVVLCLVTPHWLNSRECVGEFMAGWYGGKRMVPLLALGQAPLNELQQTHRQRVLAEDQGIDLTPCLDAGRISLAGDVTPLERLARSLRAAGALEAIGVDPEHFTVNRQTRPDPFLGLESFGDTDADAAIFYGRTAEIVLCLETLRSMRATGDHKPLAILGASGSGKSSLMNAGVLPRLRRERGWFVLSSFRPGSDPMLNFADAVVRTGKAYGVAGSAGDLCERLMQVWRDAPKGDGKTEPAGLATQAGLSSLRVALIEALAPILQRAGRPDATVLIAMDQAEEIVRGRDAADALADYLRAAISVEAGHVQNDMRLVYTIRSDQFQELQRAPRMHSLDSRGADIRPLPTHRLAEVIEGPARRYGVKIAPSVVDALVADGRGNEDALPLLAFAMNRLWRRYGEEIPQRGYEDSGRIENLLHEAAERALAGHDPSDASPIRPITAQRNDVGAKTFVLALAQLDDLGHPMRRVARLQGLQPEQREMLEHFARWRLVVTRPIASSEESTVEPAHEALYREWKRFGDWLAPKLARLDAARGLDRAARHWDRGGRKTISQMHRGRQLVAARSVMASKEFSARFDQVHKDYVKACGRSESARRWGRSLAIAFAGVAVGAGTVWFLAQRGFLG